MFGIDSTNNTKYFAQVHRPVGWGVNPTRPTSSRLALDGHTIHQTGDKDWSTAAPSVVVEVANATAAQIDAMDKALSTVFLADGDHVYEAIIDAQITDLEGRKKSVNLNFEIVRRVL